MKLLTVLRYVTMSW